MLYLSRIMLGEQGTLLIECLRAQTTRAKTPVLGNIFQSTNNKCESIPKPQYLSEIVTYEDDQTAIFHVNFAQIQFPVSNFFLLLSLPLTAMMTS